MELTELHPIKQGLKLLDAFSAACATQLLQSYIQQTRIETEWTATTTQILTGLTELHPSGHTINLGHTPTVRISPNLYRGWVVPDHLALDNDMLTLQAGHWEHYP